MRRHLTNTPIGDHVTKRQRYGLVLEDDPSGTNPLEMQTRLLKFLQSVVDQPALMQCGLAYPERFVVHHNGTSWVLQAEAVVDEP